MWRRLGRCCIGWRDHGMRNGKVVFNECFIVLHQLLDHFDRKRSSFTI